MRERDRERGERERERRERREKIEKREESKEEVVQFLNAYALEQKLR